jgi:4,5-DOPA dioxygenase extradiol
VTQLPVLYMSHGSPMHTIAPGAVGEAWRQLGRELPRPSAIVMFSAHWDTPVPAITASARPETIHDFYGFPRELYTLRYPAPGAPALAARIRELLQRAGIDAVLDAERGLDHGAWSPLLHAYPAADIPVVQVSMQVARGPAHHLAVGRALAALADEGVLIVGSGLLTHNLRDWVRSHHGHDEPPPAPYVREFRDWVLARLDAHDIDGLVDYRRQAPHAVRAHPTDEHWQPIYVALGAVTPDGGTRFDARVLFERIEGGAFAMDQIAFTPAARAA